MHPRQTARHPPREPAAMKTSACSRRKGRPEAARRATACPAKARRSDRRTKRPRCHRRPVDGRRWTSEAERPAAKALSASIRRRRGRRPCPPQRPGRLLPSARRTPLPRAARPFQTIARRTDPLRAARPVPTIARRTQRHLRLLAAGTKSMWPALPPRADRKVASAVASRAPALRRVRVRSLREPPMLLLQRRARRIRAPHAPVNSDRRSSPPPRSSRPGRRALELRRRRPQRVKATFRVSRIPRRAPRALRLGSPPRVRTRPRGRRRLLPLHHPGMTRRRVPHPLPRRRSRSA